MIKQCIKNNAARIQCFPGNSGLLDSISAKMQPTDHTSTAGNCQENNHRNPGQLGRYELTPNKQC